MMNDYLGRDDYGVVVSFNLEYRLVVELLSVVNGHHHFQVTLCHLWLFKGGHENLGFSNYNILQDTQELRIWFSFIWGLGNDN